MIKLPLLEEFKAKWSNCNQCSLHTGRTQVVFGDGNINARIAIIGEAPGEQEDLHGKPFFPDAPAGSLLNKMLGALDVEIPRDDIYITNTCVCRPHIGDRNRAPTSEEISSCNARLIEELAVIAPDILVLCGNVPLYMATGKRGITKMHGKIEGLKFALPNKIIEHVYATLHPAAFLYGSPSQVEYKKLIAYDDWKAIAKVYHNLARNN